MVYHERQFGALCGQHAVNALLQQPRFTAVDLAEIGHHLDDIVRLLLLLLSSSLLLLLCETSFRKEDSCMSVAHVDVVSCTVGARADGAGRGGLRCVSPLHGRGLLECQRFGVFLSAGQSA